MKLLIAMAAGVLGYCYYTGSQERLRKSGSREAVNRWEGEGGNVPAVATPTPAPVPKASFPEVDPNIRH